MSVCCDQKLLEDSTSSNPSATTFDVVIPPPPVVSNPVAKQHDAPTHEISTPPSKNPIACNAPSQSVSTISSPRVTAEISSPQTPSSSELAIRPLSTGLSSPTCVSDFEVVNS